jgi:restriction system protein
MVTNELMKFVLKNPNFLTEVSPRFFEEICATVLHRDGFDVHVTEKSRDGGFDIVALRKLGFGSALFLVECKRYTPDNPVGVGIVRQLSGVVESLDASGGVVMTTSRFTRDAVDFSEIARFRMNLVDAFQLRKWIARVFS